MAFFSGICLLALFVACSLAQQGEAPPPPFLEGASAETVKSFHDLLSNLGHLTDQQIDDKVKEWVGQQSEDLKTKYAAFEMERQKASEAGEQAHQAAVAKFSAEAKAADDKISAIANNPALAAKDKAAQIQAIVEGLPQNVRDEMEKAMGIGGH